MTNKEAFEAWVCAHYAGELTPSSYILGNPWLVAFNAWQAARKDALEEAALVMDTLVGLVFDEPHVEPIARDCYQYAALCIRDLASEEGGGDE